jgi:predicted phage terminase large subunit-like protein
VTYETDRAQKLSARAQVVAERAGIPWSGTRKSWKNADGGSVFATGLDSGLTGEAVDGILFCDDPVKDVVEANSATYRQRADDWMASVALTRMHPGASAIVIATRWHPDDLSGRLIARGWEHIELPAISQDGEALWPRERPIPWLQEQRSRVGEYVWASLYQCQPRARGASVFGDVHLYDPGLPMPGRKVALGVDAAYSEKTYADYSVALAMAEWGGKFYVLEVDRAQIKAPAFRERIDGMKQRHSISRSRWYTSTTEVGLAQMLGVTPIIARTDKFVRAQKYAAAWNAGKVLCPAGARWLNDFVAEHVAFTGVDDLHDDQVDAAAGAFDELAQAPPSYAGLPQIHVPRRF